MIVGIGKMSDVVSGNVKKCLTPVPGKWLKILSMKGEPQYTGKVGVIQHIDDENQIHGTWGGCAVLPDVDSFIIADDESSLAEYGKEL